MLLSSRALNHPKSCSSTVSERVWILFILSVCETLCSMLGAYGDSMHTLVFVCQCSTSAKANVCMCPLSLTYHVQSYSS
jgi:hypothetical protein